MLPVTLVVQGMLVHVNALILPLGVLFQFANSSPEPRQTCFIPRYLKEFFGMRVVERSCPISHDPCFRATITRLTAGAADPALSHPSTYGRVPANNATQKYRLSVANRPYRVRSPSVAPLDSKANLCRFFSGHIQPV